MKNNFLNLAAVVFAVSLAIRAFPCSGQVLGPGDMVPGFSLPDVSGRLVSLSDYVNEKGVIIFFTSNSCPFATGYEERMVALHRRYAPEGFKVIAINPNDEKQQPEESIEKMKTRSVSAGFPFPYLKDRSGVCNSFGANRTPCVYLLERYGNGYRVVYTGAIDSQPIKTSAPNERYLENAIRSVLKSEPPMPARTDAVGCTIKFPK